MGLFIIGQKPCETPKDDVRTESGALIFKLDCTYTNHLAVNG